MRENIAESKLSYEIMDDAAQAFLKTKIMDNIHKYFYMICFSAYLREQAQMASKSASDEEKASFSLTGGKGTYKSWDCRKPRLSKLLAYETTMIWPNFDPIMSNLLKHLKILTFKVIFLCQNFFKPFQFFFFEEYHRGLSTLTKCHREAAGLQEFFHHSDILSCITFHTK